MSEPYFKGRLQAAEMLDTGYSVRECLRFVDIIMDIRRGDEFAQGFRDAVLERC